jgi:hypothetical protein
MLNINDDGHKDRMEFENYEISSMPYESFQRQRPPYLPTSGDNIPPIDNFPPDSDSSPSFNFPGGSFNPPGMPKSPPPNYIPSKSSAGVQGFGPSGGGIGTTAVSANSIKFCLYKYTYIWEINGRNYWAFLLNIDRRSVSGFRWFRRRWVYFGVDLRRIDSFVCYRSTFEDDCENCENLRQDDLSLQSSKKEYSLNGARDVYTHTLASIDIPEVKEDSLTQTIGYVDDNVPCVKIRNIGYRITLEVTYPNNYDKILKNKINELVNEASNDAYTILSSTRSDDEYSNPLEIFNSSLSLIPEAFKTFSDSFNAKLKLLNSSTNNYSNITYSIREEKFHDNWKPYFYNNSL